MLKKFLMSAAVVVLTGVGVNSAGATTITYHTEGAFGCPGATGTVNGSACAAAGVVNSTLRLTGSPSTNWIQINYVSTTTTVDINFGDGPANIDYGTLMAFKGATTVTDKNFAGTTFTLNVFQDIPSATGGSPFTKVATLTGVLHSGSSGVFVDFGAGSTAGNQVNFSTGTATYTMEHTSTAVKSAAVLGGSSNAITSTVEITSVVPEPGSMLLLGSGLLGLGAMVRRRLRS